MSRDEIVDWLLSGLGIQKCQIGIYHGFTFTTCENDYYEGGKIIDLRCIICSAYFFRRYWHVQKIKKEFTRQYAALKRQQSFG